MKLLYHIQVDMAYLKVAIMNKLGYYLLILYFILVPVHFWTSENLSYYYKEFFAFLFFILAILLPSKKSSFYFNSEIIALILFLIYLFLCSFLFTSRELYPNSEDLVELSFSQDFYVIRNALLYLPMLLYIFKRGLIKKEIDFLLKVIAIFGIISIVAFLTYYDIVRNLSSFIKLFALGGSFLQYNSFVPYLTFPFAAAVYLSISQPRKKVKFFFYLVAFLIFAYIILTTSRQSVIFCILTLILFAVFNNKKVTYTVRILMPIIIVLVLVIPYYLQNVFISEILINKTTSLQGLTNDNTGRFIVAMEGFSKLTFIEFFVGAGISSVINSGPHTDYVRWIQRVGIIGAFLGFLPFIISFIGSFKLMRMKYSIFHIFVFVSVLYTIYISFFGYPREDAFQAPYVWLGLAFWLISKQNK